MLNNFAAIGYLLFLVVARPHENRLAMTTEVFGELTFMAAVYASFNLASGDYPDEVVFRLDPSGFRSFSKTETAGYVIIGGILVSVAIQIATHVLVLAYKLYRAYRLMIRRCRDGNSNLLSTESQSLKVDSSSVQQDDESAPALQEEHSERSRQPDEETGGDFKSLINEMVAQNRANKSQSFKVVLPVIQESEESKDKIMSDGD